MEGMAPILHVANPRASSEWYAQLGFEVESEHAFGPDWPLCVRLRCGPAQLHLSEHRLGVAPLPARRARRHYPSGVTSCVQNETGNPRRGDSACRAAGLLVRWE
jgi:hypothetical protein